MAKRALVLSGGGSKGAFAVGVVKSLSQQAPLDTSFDIFIGTSTGSLIVPFAAMNQLDPLEKIYTTITTDQIIAQDDVGDRFFHANSLLNAEPLGHLITSNYTDDFCNALFASPKIVCLVTTCLQTGQTVYFSNHEAPPGVTAPFIKTASPAIFRNAVMASACQPVLMPPIVVQPNEPSRQYVDGGVRMYAGIQLAIDAGAEEIFAVLLSPADDPAIEKVYQSPFDILERTVDIFTTDTGINNVKQPQLFSAGLRYIADVKTALANNGVSQSTIDAGFNIDPANAFSNHPPIKIYIIRPDAPLGGGPGGLNFNPDEMKAMLAKGAAITNDLLANLPPNGSDNV